MKIAKDKVVTLSYHLEVDGKTVDASPKDMPLDYIQGEHMLIPGFEMALEGMEPGELYDIIVAPEEGYGTYDERLMAELPKSAFEIEGVVHEELLVIGNVIPMLNGAGQVVQGRVASVEGDVVTMDFNHALAGKTLHFTGEILSVRDATEKEIKEGLHGEYLPQEEHHCKHGKGGCCHHHEGEDHECCHHEGEDHECCHHHEGEDHECCHKKE